MTTTSADLAYQHIFESMAATSVSADKTANDPALSTPPSSSSSQSSAQSSSISSLSTRGSSTPDSPTSTPAAPPRRQKSVIAAIFSRSTYSFTPRQRAQRKKQRLDLRRQNSARKRDSVPRTLRPDTTDSIASISRPTAVLSPIIPDAPQKSYSALSNIDERTANITTTSNMATEFQAAIDQAFPVPPSPHHAPRQRQPPQLPAVLNRPRRISSMPGGVSNGQNQKAPQNAFPRRQAQCPPSIPIRQDHYHHQQQLPRGISSHSGPPRQHNARAPSWNSSTSFEAILSSSSTPRPADLATFASNIPQSAPVRHQQQLQPSFDLAAEAEKFTPRPTYATGEQFALLPGNVLELILDELKALHLKPGSDSCASCWTRDVCSIALACRKWTKFARTSLYEHVQIVGCDSPAMKKRHKMLEFPRLALLRRTLRSSQQIAVIVKTLRVPVLTPSMNKDNYYNAVASIIMACPNFERLVALYPAYDHLFNRLFYALSSRNKLRHMDWVLEPASLPTPPARPMSSRGSQLRSRLTPLNIAPTNLNAMQSDAWLDLHSNWSHLTTLNIHALPGGALTPNNLVVQAIAQLPKLKNLFLSNLSHAAFNDEGLMALPALKTLSMTRLNGITGRGISAFANRPESRSITRLDMRHLNIESLAPICRVLATCMSLETLIFVQARAPAMPAEDMFCLMPYAASLSLRSLHWDITTPSDPSRAAPSDVILARSIAAEGFPALRSVRVPADPEGIFQALCRPVERIDLPNDRFRLTSPRAPALRSPPATPTSAKSITGKSPFLASPSTPLPALGGMVTTPISAGPGGSEAFVDARLSSHLVEARILAQARIENARQFPRFFAHVVDEQGRLIEKVAMGGFMGELQSKIEYVLLPDRHATDAAGGLLDMGHILAARDAEISGLDLCTGRWNMMTEAAYDKKDRDRWWHAESPRWTHMEL
ncbi:hypothetical protein CFIMG_005108RA [Ceratocystis fimbriata CBS 114723]|uniref:F-box domain-containing protein n=1 Tax=Ceratocystis fimbriata CBS 114723 TaxID=1035309 RepID=A0A2C5X2V4_9PEZI|nr:hypothetical protein CFIMG_005108RA [Ceratocystis fimbriata CBS 114723]